MKEIPAREQQAIDFFQHIVGDPNSVLIKDNFILDLTQGIGIILDQSTCLVSKCVMRGNPSGGLMIQSSLIKNYIEINDIPADYEMTKLMAQNALLEMASNFRFVKIDDCDMSKNERFGLLVKKFYGLVHLMDSKIMENDGHGISLSTEKSSLPHDFADEFAYERDFIDNMAR